MSQRSTKIPPEQEALLLEFSPNLDQQMEDLELRATLIDILVASAASTAGVDFDVAERFFKNRFKKVKQQALAELESKLPSWLK